MHPGMHAGEALYYLMATAKVLERRFAAQQGMAQLVNEIRSCAGVIGQHMDMPEPDAVKLQPFIDQVLAALPVARAAHGASGKKKESGGGGNNDPEKLAAAIALASEMEASDNFDWALDTIVSIKESASKETDPFVTDKQVRALKRMSVKCRGNKNFWEEFCDEHTAAASVVDAAEARADDAE